MEKRKFGQFDSWQIINEIVAQKYCDKSFFLYRGSAISQPIRWFFGAEKIDVGDRLDLVLVLNGVEYFAYIKKPNNGTDQLRIFWENDLAQIFKPYANDGLRHILEFQRISNHITKINDRTHE